MNHSKPDIPAILRRIPLLSQVKADALENLAVDVSERRMAKGEILFHRGDMPTGFHLVVTGRIKLALSSANGDEKVIEIIGPLHTFGEAVMFMDRPYPVTSEALADSLLLHIPRQTVFDLVASDSEFARAMLAGLSMRLHSLVCDVENYSLRSSAERVIGYLLQLSEESCLNRGNGCDGEIDLPTSKQIIASRLNLTPETLSRIFHRLSEEGLIKVDGLHVRVPDINRLRNHDH